MKITSVSVQAKNKNRVNISVDGKYRFSLDIFQVGELGIKTGKEYSEKELVGLETESQFGKLYTQALEYCLMRPRSQKEVRDYLRRKTFARKYKSRQTGEIKEKAGAPQEIADRVLQRLIEKNYVNDEAFTRFWLENRHQTKGASHRKLISELRAKGVETTIIEDGFKQANRNDSQEIQKIIAKKRRLYGDEQKLIAYLARQGFHYSDIKDALKPE